MMDGMKKKMTLALDPKHVSACLEDIEQRIEDGRPLVMPGAETVLVTLRADLAVIETFAEKHAISAKMAEGCDVYRRLIGHIESLPKGPQGGTVGASFDSLNTEALAIPALKALKLSLCPTGVDKCWDDIELMLAAGHKVVSMGHEKVLDALREDLQVLRKREVEAGALANFTNIPSLCERYQALLDRGERILAKVQTVNGEARADALKTQAERN